MNQAPRRPVPFVSNAQGYRASEQPIATLDGAGVAERILLGTFVSEQERLEVLREVVRLRGVGSVTDALLQWRPLTELVLKCLAVCAEVEGGATDERATVLLSLILPLASGVHCNTHETSHLLGCAVSLGLVTHNAAIGVMRIHHTLPTALLPLLAPLMPLADPDELYRSAFESIRCT